MNFNLKNRPRESRQPMEDPLRSEDLEATLSANPNTMESEISDKFNVSHTEIEKI